MEVFLDYHEVPEKRSPLILSIGKFDSLHLGHRFLLNQAKELANRMQGYLCVITFSNHPLEVLKEGVAIQRLFTLPHRLKLLSEIADGSVVLTFTKELAKQTAEEFIESLYRQHPFGGLVMGYDARLGKDLQGNTPLMHRTAKKFGFELYYSAPYLYRGAPVSGSRIREAIGRGDLADVERMLGRKYSVYTSAYADTSNQVVLMDLSGLVLPPSGIYPVSVFHEGEEFGARATVERESSVALLQFDKEEKPVFTGPLEAVFNFLGDSKNIME